MKRKNLVIGAVIIGITVLATGIFWYGFSSEVFSGSQKYLVQVRYFGVINSVKAISIIFLQGNKSIASSIVKGDGTWHNLTVPSGLYTVKAYNADSGQYLRQYQINVAKDIQFEVSP